MEKNHFSVAVIARMHHGILYQTLKRLGLSQADAARMLGISLGQFGEIIRLRRKPCFTTEKGRKLKQKLEELTDHRIEELFPDSVYTPEFLAKPKTIEALAEAPIHLLTHPTNMFALPLAPDEELMWKEEREGTMDSPSILDKVLSTLTKREEVVIRQVFFKEKTLEETASGLKLTKERVRQIEAKALRKLRHPMRSRVLEGLMIDI